MAFDKSILSSVLRELELTRSAHEAEAERRKLRLYRELPRLAVIDRELRGTSARAIRAALSSNEDAERAILELRDRNLALQDEKRSLLVQHGYTPDYLAPEYDCPVCRDTGYADGRLCRCVKEKAAAEQTRRLSTILPIDTENFSSFRFDYYSSAVDQRLGVSPEFMIRDNYNTCRAFADSFGTEYRNLLLFGSTGLGKTFLSSCIARAVSENGFSVAYDTASHVFDCCETVKFRSEAAEDAAAQLERYRAADLLILDDLGTEMSTAFTASCLYDLINTRLLERRPMIINTNLTPEDIQRRYSPAVASRVLGEFTLLRFIGDDIRRIRSRERR